MFVELPLSDRKFKESSSGDTGNNPNASNYGTKSSFLLVCPFWRPIPSLPVFNNSFPPYPELKKMLDWNLTFMSIFYISFSESIQFTLSDIPST